MIYNVSERRLPETASIEADCNAEVVSADTIIKRIEDGNGIIDYLGIKIKKYIQVGIRYNGRDINYIAIRLDQTDSDTTKIINYLKENLNLLEHFTNVEYIRKYLNLKNEVSPYNTFNYERFIPTMELLFSKYITDEDKLKIELWEIGKL